VRRQKFAVAIFHGVCLAAEREVMNSGPCVGGMVATLLPGCAFSAAELIDGADEHLRTALSGLGVYQLGRLLARVEGAMWAACAWSVASAIKTAWCGASSRPTKVAI
jgi:hypothetical protein